MALDPIPFNTSTSVDPQTLREKANDPDQMKQSIDWLLQKIKTFPDKDCSQEHGKLLLRVGSFERIVGDLPTAEKHIQAAREIFRKLGKVDLIIATELRLANTYLHKGQLDLAENLYLECIKKIQPIPGEHKSQLLDYALTNYGKLFFERRQYQTCMQKFVEALEFKLISGDQEAIAAHQKLMEFAQSAAAKNQAERK